MTGLDIDAEALETAQDNVLNCDCADRVDLILCDVLKASENPRFAGYFDTIVMNPPFGTKSNEGIDMKLLSAAIKVIKFSDNLLVLPWGGVLSA